MKSPLVLFIILLVFNMALLQSYRTSPFPKPRTIRTRDLDTAKFSHHVQCDASNRISSCIVPTKYISNTLALYVNGLKLPILLENSKKVVFQLPQGSSMQFEEVEQITHKHDIEDTMVMLNVSLHCLILFFFF